MVGIALLTKVVQIASNPQANQVPLFLPVAEGFDLKEVAFELSSNMTGISERDRVNIRGSFARRVNSIPSSGEIWSPSGRYLWDIYREVLEGPVQLANNPVSSDEESKVKTARAIIGPPDNPSPKYKKYMSYKDRYWTLEKILREAKEKLINTTELERKNVIQTEIDQYQIQLGDLKQEWIAVGYKIEIEEALHKLSDSVALRPFIRWTSWENDFNSLNQQADGNGNFWPTAYHPDNLYEEDTSWNKVTLSKSEIDSLENNAPPELSRFRDIMGDRVSAQGDIEEVSMEIARVDVERPWFHPELLTSRFWKWKLSGEQPLSNGAEPWPNGSLPGYIVGLVLVRNIKVMIPPPPPPPSGGGHSTYDGPPVCPPGRCRLLRRRVPNDIFILGNLALQLSKVSEEGQPISVRPMRGELLRLENNIPSYDSLREVLSSHSIAHRSIEEDVLLMAYIVQKSPKSPNPDPNLIW